MDARTRTARGELDQFFNEGALRNKLESHLSTDAMELLTMLVSRYTGSKEEVADEMLGGEQVDI
jgi:hypothetical protein